MTTLPELFSTMTQIGIVVRDLDKIRKNMKMLFGLDPSRELSGIHTNATYNGKPNDRIGCACLFYTFCNVEIEYIMPLTEQNVWQDFLREHGEGIHHVRFSVKDHEPVNRWMAEKGIPIIQSGDIYRGKNLTYAYYNTAPKIGFVIETNDDFDICYWQQVRDKY